MLDTATQNPSSAALSACVLKIGLQGRHVQHRELQHDVSSTAISSGRFEPSPRRKSDSRSRADREHVPICASVSTVNTIDCQCAWPMRDRPRLRADRHAADQEAHPDDVLPEAVREDALRAAGAAAAA